MGLQCLYPSRECFLACIIRATCSLEPSWESVSEVLRYSLGNPHKKPKHQGEYHAVDPKRNKRVCFDIGQKQFHGEICGEPCDTKSKGKYPKLIRVKCPRAFDEVQSSCRCHRGKSQEKRKFNSLFSRKSRRESSYDRCCCP